MGRGGDAGEIHPGSDGAGRGRIPPWLDGVTALALRRSSRGPAAVSDVGDLGCGAGLDGVMAPCATRRGGPDPAGGIGPAAGGIGGATFACATPARTRPIGACRLG